VFHVVLFQPEIPPNTGNIIRLCANSGAALHLIEPCGFSLDEPRLRRAGLDYHEWARVQTWSDLPAFLDAVSAPRLFAFSRNATRCHSDVAFEEHDALLFGPETRGLPPDVLKDVVADRQLRIPMQPGSRSLNLSNAVAVAVYEAWRQLGFAGEGS
jgi:tRNA (cytidine/uridine-2'-O-)-methyltransferase